MPGTRRLFRCDAAYSSALRSAGCAIALAAAVLAGGRALAQADAVGGSIRALRNAVTVQRDGQHLRLLRALRALEDPTLQPMFTRLSEQRDLFIRINGLLGLAELSERRRIDPFLIRQLEGEVERLQAIEQALAFELADVEAIRDMLAWDDLEDAPRLTLLAALVARDEAVDTASLQPFLEHEKETLRSLAAMLHVQVTGARDAFANERSHIDSLQPAARREAHLWLLNDIGRYRLDAMLWWIEDLLADAATEDQLAHAAIAAAIAADPPRGIELWTQRATTHPDHASLVRLGLVLLAMASEHDIPAQPWALLRNSRDLTERIADFGEALAAGQTDPAVTAASRLIDLNHWQSANHVLFAAAKLDAAAQSQIYQHFISRVEGGDPERLDERINLALRAVPLLLEVDRAAAESLLAAAADNSVLQEVILMGLLATDDAAAGELAQAAPRSSPIRADSLALLLIARHTPAGELPPADISALAVIAAGGGQLSPAHQVQAAWLHLKHAGRIEYAMGELFAE